MTTTTIMTSWRCDDDDNDDTMTMITTMTQSRWWWRRRLWCWWIWPENQKTHTKKTKQTATKNTIVPWTYPDRHLKLSCGLVSTVSTGRYDTTPSYPLQQDQKKKSLSVSRSRGFQSRPDQHSGPQSNKICPGMPSIGQFRYFTAEF